MKKLSEEKYGKNFGEVLRKWRISRNFTQENISEKIGISREWVSKIECGKSSPNCYDLLIFMIVIKFKTIEEVNSFLKEATADVSLYTR